MSDQPVAKASTYTGQHKTETQRQTSMPQAGFEPTIPVTKRPNLCLRLHSHQDGQSAPILIYNYYTYII